MALANIRRPAELFTNELTELRRWQKHTTDNIDRINATALEQTFTTADITLNVMNGSSISTALASIPKYLEHDVIIRIGPGTYDGFIVDGFLGTGSLRIAGSTSPSTLTSGAQTGTANAGTTSTSLVKPAGAADWTAGDLRNKYLKITSGGGASDDTDFPTLRAIVSNTLTTLSVYAVADMDNTTKFEIVDIATIIDTLVTSPITDSTTMNVGILVNACAIAATCLAPTTATADYGILAYDCAKVTLSGITNVINNLIGVSFAEVTEATASDFFSTYVLEALRCGKGDFLRIVQEDDGQIDMQNLAHATCSVDADGCTVNAIRMRHCVRGLITSNTYNGTATPVRLENVHFAEVAATGANAGTTYGIEISEGGQFIVTGSTVEGAAPGNALLLETTPMSWAVVALGTMVERGTYVHWGVGQLRFSGTEIAALNGLTNGGIQKEFGYHLILDNGITDSAFRPAVTAFPGGGQANAELVGYQLTNIAICAAGGDSVKFRAVPVGGTVGTVINSGANSADLFPPTGGTINGGPVNTQIAVPAGSWAFWISTSTIDYKVKVV